MGWPIAGGKNGIEFYTTVKPDTYAPTVTKLVEWIGQKGDDLTDIQIVPKKKFSLTVSLFNIEFLRSITLSQFKARILRQPTSFDHWLIASFDTSYEHLVEVLSDPHFIQNDPTKTAGGSEYHWAFEFEGGIKVGILFREPYGETNVFADPPNTVTAVRNLEKLLTGKNVTIADPPILFE